MCLCAKLSLHYFRVCDCGYLTSLLTCLKDPVTSVASKALEIIQFIGNLITKYEIRIEKSKPKSRSVVLLLFFSLLC